jgi:hypothetical protein
MLDVVLNRLEVPCVEAAVGCWQHVRVSGKRHSCIKGPKEVSHGGFRFIVLWMYQSRCFVDHAV